MTNVNATREYTYGSDKNMTSTESQMKFPHVWILGVWWETKSHRLRN